MTRSLISMKPSPVNRSPRPRLLDAVARIAQKGELARAVADYDEAIRLDPNNAAIFLNRGAAMNYVQNYSRAIEDLDQAIRLDERNAGAYHNRGVAYSKMGESTRAKADLDQAKILTDR